MKLKIYFYTAAIGVGIAAGFWLIDPKISLGILLSSGYSLINMLLLSMSMKSALSQDMVNSAALVSANIVRFALMAAVIYIAVKNPKIFNMIGVAIGFILFLFALLIDAFSRKGG